MKISHQSFWQALIYSGTMLPHSWHGDCFGGNCVHLPMYKVITGLLYAMQGHRIRSWLEETPMDLWRCPCTQQKGIVLVTVIITVAHSTMHKVLIGLLLTLTLPGPSAGVSGSLDSYCSLKPLWSGMGEVVPARTLLTLLPPSPRIVLSLSCIKVLQCINCRD